MVVTCLLVAALGGCGSGGESTVPPPDPAKELARWFKGVEAAVARKEQNQRAFTRFRVRRPPPGNDLVELSPAGARAGETAARAAARLDASTTLSAAEASGLYCYFFSFYVDLEFFPDEKEFELVIFNLVKASLSPSASPTDIRESADALRKAMIEAEKAGGRGPEVAAAFLC